MLTEKSLLNQRFTVAIIVIILTIFGANALLLRPVITYFMDAPNSYSPDYETSLMVALKFRNAGNTNADIRLKLIVTNAQISDYRIEYPNRLISDTEAEFIILAPKNMESYQRIDVWIEPDNEIDHFSIEYNVLKKKSYSTYSGIIASIFGEIKPLYPTYLTYKKGANNAFTIETP